MFVKVAKMGCAVKEVMLEDGATPEAAIEAADHDATGFQIKVNNEAPRPLRNGDIVTLVPTVKGGLS